MKKKWFGVLWVLASVALIFSVFTIPVDAGLVLISSVAGNDGYALVNNGTWLALRYVPSSSFIFSGLELNIYSSHYHAGRDDVLVVSLCTGVDAAHMVQINPPRSNVFDLDVDTGAYTKRLYYYSYKMEAGTTYWFHIFIANAVDTYANLVKSNGTSNCWKYTVATKVWSAESYTINYKIYGVYEPAPILSTKPATINDNGLFFNGILSYFNADAEVCFEYGMATGDYETVTLPKIIKVSATEPSASFQSKIQPVEGTYYFRAKAITGNFVLYGSELSFVVTGVPGVDTPIIKTNKAKVDYYYFEASADLIALGTDSDVDIYMDWGYTPAMNETPVELGLVVVSPGNTEVVKVGATSGTKFYYQARMVGDTVITRGELLTGRTFSESKSWIVNFIDSLFEGWGLGLGIWWLVILLLMVAVWVPEELRERKIIPIILDFVILGAAIALAVIDIWLVVVLAVIAASIIGVVVVRKVANG